MAAAKEISVDAAAAAAVVAVRSERDGIFTRQRTALKPFLSAQHCFS